MSNDRQIVRDGKPWAFLSYLWILCFVPLLMKRENKFCMFHAKQGLILFIGSVLMSIFHVIPLIGIAAFVVNVFIIIFNIIGLYYVLIGKCGQIPVVGIIAQKINI